MSEKNMEYTKDIVRQDSKQYIEVKLQIKILHCELGFKYIWINLWKMPLLCALSNLMWWLLPIALSKMLQSEQSFVYVLNES